MDEEELTLQDLENMDLNTDILKLDMLYSNEEAKEILNNEKEISYTTSNHLEQYKDNPVIPKFKKNIIRK